MPLFTVPNAPTPDSPRRQPRTPHRLWARMREVTIDAHGNHHASAGSAIGGQFVSKGTGSSAASDTEKASGSSLNTGTVESARMLGGGVNASLIVELEDGTKAVFKPEVGESWPVPGRQKFANDSIESTVLNHQFSLAEREAMAHEVDQALGLGLVPETVHRTTLPGIDLDDVESSSDDDAPEYQEDELRDMYQQYRDENFDRAAEQANDELYELYAEAQAEHVEDIKNRVDEIAEIWNEVIDDHPELEVDQYGSPTAKQRHPRLADIGSQRPDGAYVVFDRKNKQGGEVDPMDIIDEANVDVSYKLTASERDRVRAVVERYLLDLGADELGEVDEDRAREHLDYVEWLEGHNDTENRLIDQKLQSFESWVQGQGYDLPGERAPGSVRRANKEAPHPEGGSLQRFIEDLSGYGDLEGEDLHKFAILDYALGSLDRHGGNILFRGDNGRPIAIDNGYSMPSHNNVVFRSEPVLMFRQRARRNPEMQTTPEPLRASVKQRLDSFDWQSLSAQHQNMTSDERESFLERIDQLRDALDSPTGLYELWSSQEVM